MKESVQTVLILIFAIVIVLGALVFFAQQQESQEIEFIYEATPEMSPMPTETPGPVVIDIEGGVINPGVYTLPRGSRVEDSIKAAGGFTEDADAARLSVSRAALLQDQQRIVVPKKRQTSNIPIPNVAEAGEVAPAEVASQDGDMVNINTASKSALIKLKGVGEKTAEKIIARREEKGPFTAIEQLVEEKIMFKSTFDKVKDKIAL